MNDAAPSAAEPRTPRLAPGLWRAVAGWAVWAVAFTVLYAGHALACRYVDLGNPETLTPTGVTSGMLMLWGAFALANGFLTAKSWMRSRQVTTRKDRPSLRDEFMCRLALVLDATALCATIVTGLPVLVTPVCAA